MVKSDNFRTAWDSALKGKGYVNLDNAKSMIITNKTGQRRDLVGVKENT